TAVCPVNGKYTEITMTTGNRKRETTSKNSDRRSVGRAPAPGSQAWSHRGSRCTTFVANLRSDRSTSTCPLGRSTGEDTDSVIKPVDALRGRALLRTNIKLATPAAAAASTEIS